VLLTIWVFWFAGLLWEAFRDGERLGKIAGGVVMLLANALTAHDALTNDGYRTSRIGRGARLTFFVGLAGYLVSSYV
jgi:hypothetical protein